MSRVRERIESPPLDFPKEVITFSASINVPPVIGGLLVERGIDTFEKAKTFFRPSLESLSNPFGMPDMEKAVARIRKAIGEGESIVLYGDYDVDGISGCAVLYRALKHLGAKADTYLPNRLEEGYGLSRNGLEKVKEQGSSLLITVDCGITGNAEIEFAKSLGMDVIVTDHHEPGPALPEALAILNPKCAGSSFLEKDLAGVGVAFKLGQALMMDMPDGLETLHGLLDLVALGSAADIVPLLGENRTLVKFGMERMRKSTNLGVQALLREAGLYGKNLKTHHIVFSLAPMINAVGRLGNPMAAYRLLVTEDPSLAAEIVASLRKENDRRKDVDREVTAEAIRMVEERPEILERKVIVLASRAWHPGVIGIVSSRLVEQFYRPAIMISIDEDGMGKGSARSIPEFHILDALSECSEHLDRFGGHKYAAGITIQESRIDAFRQRLAQVAEERLAGVDMVPTIHPCGALNLSAVDARFMRLLELLEPFGPGNRRPVFYGHELKLSGKPSVVGQNHLKFRVRKNGSAFDAIAFDMGERKAELDRHRGGIGLAFGLEENVWNGISRIQLRIKGIQLEESIRGA